MQFFLSLVLFWLLFTNHPLGNMFLSLKSKHHHINFYNMRHLKIGGCFNVSRAEFVYL